MHGANRLGTNSLLDLVVFGRAVGLFLESHDLDHREEDSSELDRALSHYHRWENPANTENPYEIRNEMKEVMQNSFGVFRDGQPMAEGLKKLEVLSERLQKAKLNDHSHVFNTTRIEMLELDNLMASALASAASAEHRTESRGAHSRYDFTERDDKNWLKHTVYFPDGTMHYRPVNMKPLETEAIPLQERSH